MKGQTVAEVCPDQTAQFVGISAAAAASSPAERAQQDPIAAVQGAAGDLGPRFGDPEDADPYFVGTKRLFDELNIPPGRGCAGMIPPVVVAAEP